MLRGPHGIVSLVPMRVSTQDLRLAARTFARFPGPHGRAYRLLVISSHAHVVATRRILASMRRACLGSSA